MGDCEKTIETGTRVVVQSVDNGFILTMTGRTYKQMVALDKESVIKILTEQL